jgi:hypothetical protein
VSDADAGVVEQSQCVVLILDQPADGREWDLVLELAVEQRPADAVPAIRPEVACVEDLREEPSWRLFDRQHGRRGSTRSLEAKRPDR